MESVAEIWKVIDWKIKFSIDHKNIYKYENIAKESGLIERIKKKTIADGSSIAPIFFGGIFKAQFKTNKDLPFRKGVWIKTYYNESNEYGKSKEWRGANYYGRECEDLSI